MQHHRTTADQYIPDHSLRICKTDIKESICGETCGGEDLLTVLVITADTQQALLKGQAPSSGL